jgi:hypothetical protein
VKAATTHRSHKQRMAYKLQNQASRKIPHPSQHQPFVTARNTARSELHLSELHCISVSYIAVSYISVRVAHPCLTLRPARLFAFAPSRSSYDELHLQILGIRLPPSQALQHQTAYCHLEAMPQAGASAPLPLLVATWQKGLSDCTSTSSQINRLLSPIAIETGNKQCVGQE